ncbi:MAG: hypothetical protein DMG93_11210 [Acidobacteria bacterium]|nr:MAG: hypothetical protein DMG93_11210 [Acidobacteriota bacterium]
MKLSDTKSAIIVYREIRIEDKFTDENGSQVRLKPEAGWKSRLKLNLRLLLPRRVMKECRTRRGKRWFYRLSFPEEL